jgi:hypothetical protein
VNCPRCGEIMEFYNFDDVVVYYYCHFCHEKVNARITCQLHEDCWQSKVDPISFLKHSKYATLIYDESSIRKPEKSVKEILCYLKFGKCDPKTMEIYERLKSKEETK